jgi:hypothetical protein
MEGIRNVRLFSAAAIAAGIVLGSIGSAGADSTTYAVGVTFGVVLTQPVTTETAHVGDTFFFKTAEDVKLGDVDLPAGTPGTGRLATAVAATSTTTPQLALQADSLTNGAETIWVNIDPSVKIKGHYSTHRDLVIDPGATFSVLSILPRAKLAPLVTPPPENSPTTTNAVPGPSPSASPKPAT